MKYAVYRKIAGWDRYADALAHGVHLAADAKEGQEFLLCRVPETFQTHLIQPEAEIVPEGTSVRVFSALSGESKGFLMNARGGDVKTGGKGATSEDFCQGDPEVG